MAERLHALKESAHLATHGPSESLAGRAIRAGVWTLVFRTAARGIGFIRNIILARILSPDDIGLFGIVLVTLSILDRFTETGVRTALVQKKGEVEAYLDSAWTILALRRIILALLLFGGAPWVAGFFNEPRAIPLIQLLGFSFFILAFDNIAVVQFERQLDAKRQFISAFGGTITDIAVSVALAFYLRSAWALLYGLVANRLVTVAVSYAVHSYRPRLRVDWGQTWELARFGRWVLVNNILAFFSQRGDNLIVGKLLGAPALGVYMLAFSISEVATVEITRTINNVALPSYSRAQGEHQRVLRGFVATTELVSSLSLSVAIGLTFLASSLVATLLGEQWSEVAAVLPPLAFAGCARALVANANVLSMGLGHPEHGSRCAGVQVIVMYAAMVPLFKLFGLTGVAYAVLIGALASVPLAFHSVLRLLDLPSGALVRMLTPGCLLGAGVAFVLLVTTKIFQDNPVLSFVLGGTFAATSFAAVSFSIWRLVGAGPLRILTFYRSTRNSPVRSKTVYRNMAPEGEGLSSGQTDYATH